MNKEFLDVSVIRDNAIRLADKIYNDGFIPNIILVGLRGGSTFGNAISEYFKLISPIDTPPLYAAVVSHSYVGLESTQRIHIDGWTFDPKHIRRNDKVLLIDDIFDSGLTINVIADTILKHDLAENMLRIAVHDYKIRLFKQEKHKYLPDYYSRKFEINTPEEDNWIHYMSHELDGLSETELTQHYDTDIQPYIRKLLAIRNKQIEIYKQTHK